MIGQLHVGSAILAAVSGLAVAVIAVLALATGARSGVARASNRRSLDRAILGALAGLAVGALTGLWQLAAGSHPADPLHYLYAVVAVLILPAARFGGSGWWDRNRGRVVVLGGLILVALVMRLYQTGG